MREDRSDNTDDDGQHHAVPQDRGRRFLHAGPVILRLIHRDGADNADAEDIRDIIKIRGQGRRGERGLAEVAGHGDIHDEHQAVPEHPQHNRNRQLERGADFRTDGGRRFQAPRRKGLAR